jgi:transposase
MSKTSKARVFSRELKLSAVRRMLTGENVSALARELAVLRKDLTSGGTASGRAGRRRCGRPAGRLMCG